MSNNQVWRRLISVISDRVISFVRNKTQHKHITTNNIPHFARNPYPQKQKQPHIFSHNKNHPCHLMKFLLSLTLALLQHSSHASGFATVKGPSTSPIIPTTLKLLHPRGGNIPTSHAASASEYDSSSSDDDEASESSEVDLVTSRFADIAAQNAKKMSNFSMDPSSRRQLSNSYSLAAAFWTSLTFDSLLNKKKRSLLFPGSAEVGGRMMRDNLAVSASLASGFMLSAGLAYFLYKDLKKDDASWDEELKSEAMRKKLHLLLCVYGTGNLFANINPGSAPFLGMGGFVINFHNALIALNGWRKESSSSAPAGSGRLLKTVASLPKNLFRTPDLSMGFRVRVMSSLYMVASIIAALRGFDIISNSLVPHYLTCLACNSVSFN